MQTNIISFQDHYHWEIAQIDGFKFDSMEPVFVSIPVIPPVERSPPQPSKKSLKSAIPMTYKEYTQERRRSVIERYQGKRSRRNYSGYTRYPSRSVNACIKPRIGGRFCKRTE